MQICILKTRLCRVVDCFALTKSRLAMTALLVILSLAVARRRIHALNLGIFAVRGYFPFATLRVSMTDCGEICEFVLKIRQKFTLSRELPTPQTPSAREGAFFSPNFTYEI